MDFIDAFWLVAECLIVGFGLAAGDLLLKALAVRVMNTHIVTIAESDEVEEEEEPITKKARKRAPRS